MGWRGLCTIGLSTGLHAKDLGHIVALILLLALAGGAAFAQTVEVPRSARSARFTGKINFVTTGGSLRTESNTGNACNVGTTSSGALTGIPAGTTVLAAYLYWGGSASTSGAGATVVDASVTLNGAAINTSRSFTGSYDNAGTALRFFGGAGRRHRARHRQRQLHVRRASRSTPARRTVARRRCSPDGALVVIYQGHERTAARDQHLRRPAVLPWQCPDADPRRISHVPASNIDGRIAVLTWEGDPGNSDPLNGFSESLRFNGTAIDDGLVPAGSSPHLAAVRTAPSARPAA